MRPSRFIALLCLALVACPTAPLAVTELCDNRLDDDRNGKVDCLDPACVETPACSFGELCDNGKDDNANKLTDCADALCEGRSCGLNCVCYGRQPHISDGGAFDAGLFTFDGGPVMPDSGMPPMVDSGVRDSGMSQDSGVPRPDAGRPDAGGATADAGFPPETACFDGLDNDHDGLTDCADPTCVGVGVEICHDGVDNTCNGLVDCAEPSCVGAGTELCTDGLDNTCDGFVDCADPTCVGVGIENCTDGVDNTCDRAIDCGDPKCVGNAACTSLADGAPCAADAECAGASCMTEAVTGHPNGSCTSAGSCDVNGCSSGLCTASSRDGRFVCRAVCTSTGADACRAGFACDDGDGDSQTYDTVCVPLCLSDLDCAVTSNAGYGCNPVSKRCELKARGLALYGAGCNSDSQCETGRCTLNPEANGSTGSCTGLCRNDANNCGPGGFCTGESVYVGDNVSVCLQSCTDSSQCRAPGYQCRERTPGEPATQVCACGALGEYCSQGVQCCSGRCFHAQCESL